MSDSACSTAAAPSSLDANTEAMLRADIEQVLAKYRLQATDVKVEIGHVAPVPPTSPLSSPPRVPAQPSVSETRASETLPSATLAPQRLSTTAPPEPLPEVTGLSAAPLSAVLNPSNFIPPEIQAEMGRQRQRDERDRILKSFTGKSVLLADKKKRDEEKRQPLPHYPPTSAARANGLQAAAVLAAATSARPAPPKSSGTTTTIPAAPSPTGSPTTHTTTNTNVFAGTAPATAGVESRASSSGGGSPPGSRHMTVSLPEEAPAGDGRLGSERRYRSGAQMPVFSILSKEGSVASGGSQGGSMAQPGVSVKDSPAPPAEVVHTPATGECAAPTHVPSILRSSLGSGSSSALPALPPLAQTSVRTALVQSQIHASQENQRRASDLARPTATSTPASTPTTLPPACASGGRRPTPLGTDGPKPSLRELLAAQEKEERVVEQKLTAHQRLLSELRHSSPRQSLDGCSTPSVPMDTAMNTSSAGLTPSPPPTMSAAAAAGPVRPAPPLSPVRTTSPQHSTRPSSSASGARALSARSSIQVCRVTLPTEPKARAEVVEQFCASTAGQAVLGTKSRYEHLLAAQQQLLDSRKKDDKEYQTVLAKAVELNQKLRGP